MKIFYRALLNSLIVSIANNTVWFAITFWVYLETMSVISTALVGGIYLIVTTCSSFWFGSLVDHNKKKDVMMLSSLISLGIFLSGLALYLLTPLEEFSYLTSFRLWAFIILLMMGVIAGNIRSITVPTLVSLLIPANQRDKANGLSGMLFGISFMCTSLISGFLLAYGGMFWVLMFVIAATVFAIIHLTFLDIPEKRAAAENDPNNQKNKIDIIGTIKVIQKVPGLMALLLFATFNNFLGGVFMALMDAYGLSLVPVEIWGTLWGIVSIGFIIGGLLVSRKGIGKKPLRTLFLINICSWSLCILFPLQPWVVLLAACMFLNMTLMPFAEAAEQTVIQKVVPFERQGRVFGFAQSLEWAATPLTALMIGPIAQYIFIPFMSEGGAGAELIGSWFGVGTGRGLALVFIMAGIVGLIITILAMSSKSYKLLSKEYQHNPS
jgi:MFS transporter, DHA3 family, multidrug efflux protein